MDDLQPPTMKALIIESKDPVRHSIADILAREGYDSLHAPDGRAGLQLAKNAHPDIIVCNVHLSEMDGFRVLIYLRQETGMAAIPFIFLSTDTERSLMRRAMDLGADDYIIEPFTSKELLGAIRARMERKRAFSRSQTGPKPETIVPSHHP
jgi:DNA-binding response OmpR family regulator